MSSKNPRGDQRIYFKRQVAKLQKLGLLGKVDLRKKGQRSVINKIYKYRDVLSGKAAAVKAPDKETAVKLRGKFGLRGVGSVVVVPKEKREKYSISKAGELKSTRPGYVAGEKIVKVIGEKKERVPKPGERAYYTLPERKRGLGKLKRKTFASFDELLYYMMKYEIDFEEIEDFIEVEYIDKGSRKEQRLDKKIHEERAAAIKRRGRKRKRVSRYERRRGRGHG